VYDVIGTEEEVPVGDGRMRCINDGVAGTVMLIASRRRLDANKQQGVIRMHNRRCEASTAIQTRFPTEVSVSERLRVRGHVCIRRVAVLWV